MASTIDPPSPPRPKPAFARLKASIRAAAVRSKQNPPPPSSYRDEPSLVLPRPSEDSRRDSLDSDKSNSRLGFVRAFRRTSFDSKDTEKDKERERAKQLEKDREKERREKEKEDRKQRELKLKEEKEQQSKKKAEQEKARSKNNIKLLAAVRDVEKQKDNDNKFTFRPFHQPTLSKGSMSSPTLHLLAGETTPQPSIGDLISTPRQRRPSQPSSTPGPSHVTPTRPSSTRPPNTPLRIRTGASASTSHLPLVTSPSSPPFTPSRPVASRSPPPSPSPIPQRIPTRSPPPPISNGLTRLPNSSTHSLTSSPTSRSPPSPQLRRITRTPSPSPHSPKLPPPPLSTPATRELHELIRAASCTLIKHVGTKQPPYGSSRASREWEEVQRLLQGLVRLQQRYWTKSTGEYAVNASAALDEKERRYFTEALKDGYVLCIFLNTLLPPQTPLLKPSLSKASYNIPRFLSALQTHFQQPSSSSQTEHVPAFLPDDLVADAANVLGAETQWDGMKRVAACIVSMGRVRETHIAALNRESALQRQLQEQQPQSPTKMRGIYDRGGAGSMSTPNLGMTLQRSISPTSPNSPGKGKRWSPPLPTLRSASPSAEAGVEKPNRGKTTQEPEVEPDQESGVRRREREKPPDPPPLMRSAPSSPTAGDRASVSTTGTTATYLSSLFTAIDNRSSMATKFGTVRTMATDVSGTSSGVEEPAAAGGGGYDDRGERWRTSELKRGRRLSEVAMGIDLGRVAEENEDAGVNSIKPKEKPHPAPINLKKGKWPDDFMDLLAASPSPSPSTSPTTSGFARMGGRVELEQGGKIAPDSSGTEREEVDQSNGKQQSATISPLVQQSAPPLGSSRRPLRIRRGSSGAGSTTGVNGSSPHSSGLSSPSPTFPNDSSAVDGATNSPYSKQAATIQSSSTRNLSSSPTRPPGMVMPLSSSPPRIRPIPRTRLDSTSSITHGSLLPKSSPRTTSPTPISRRNSAQAGSQPSAVGAKPTLYGLRDGSRERIGNPHTNPVLGGGTIEPADDMRVVIDGSAVSGAGPVPFPKRSSGEYKKKSDEYMRPNMHAAHSSAFTVLPALPSTSLQEGAIQGLPKAPSSQGTQRPPLSRGRFQSEISGANQATRSKALSQSGDEYGTKGRGRTESMINLGAEEGVSSMMRDRGNDNGNGIRKTLIVKEEGKPPIHYQLGNCIGRGQFGSVYRALNLNTGQTVAVKRIALSGLTDPEVTQLMNEVDLLKRLSHPSIVKYEGMARDSDTLSIVLEYVENGSLLHTLKAFGRLNERLVASYVIKILEGLHYLHKSQVVHCDLKAANILTTKNGNVKLSDFGVSLNLRAMENIKSDVAGTPNWMAPEVIELKGASTSSDIWSLGCTIVELVTGKPPYADILNGMTVLFRIVDDAMPPLPENCSDSLRDFLTQCFQKSPAKRPSAELLFEHDWLKKAWGLNKDLRPQDSIPFLKRVSAELARADITRQLSGQDLLNSDSPMTENVPSPDEGFKVPGWKRTSGQYGGDSDFGAKQQHSFVKTSFSKAVICRVCQQAVKTKAVLCQECSLIAHSRCAPEAPATCDIRTQLLLYAQYTHEGTTPIPSPQTENLTSGSPSKQPETPLSSSPSTGGLNKIFSRKKSRQNYKETSPEPNVQSISPSRDEEFGKRNLLFGRGRASDDRSRSRNSLGSNSSPNSSSLRSTLDRLDSTATPSGGSRLHLSNSQANVNAPNSPSRKRTSITEADMSRHSHITPSSANNGSSSPSPRTHQPPSPVEPPETRRRNRLSRAESHSSKNGCLVQ